MRRKKLKLGETEVHYTVTSDGSIILKSRQYYVNIDASEVSILDDQRQEVFNLYPTSTKNTHRYIGEVNHERIEGEDLYEVVVKGLLTYMDSINSVIE